MTKPSSLLGFIWTLPISVLAWTAYFILYLFHQINGFYFDKKDLTLTWQVDELSWCGRKLFKKRGFNGFSAGNNILVLETKDTAKWSTLLLHEKQHCYQQYKSGIFFFPLYILESVRIYLFDKSRHSYYGNRFEVAARKAAGQIKGTPEDYMPDTNERWIWW
jgi:hypothetical protein